MNKISSTSLSIAGVALAGLLTFGCDTRSDLEPIASIEEAPADEPAWIEETAALTVALQDKRAPGQGSKLLRGVHAKSHGCVAATMTVDHDLDEIYRVGVFAKPGRVYDARIRFSNAAVLVEDDLKANGKGERQNGSRGMAIKLLDVKGSVLNKDKGRPNQDFLMINTPEFAFANVRDYLRLNRILDLSERGDDPSFFFAPLKLASTNQPMPPKDSPLWGGFGQDISAEDYRETDAFKRELASSKIVGKIASQTVRNPLEVQYFGAAPFLFGPDRVMKFSARPCGDPVPQEPFTTVTSSDPSENYLRKALTKRIEGDQGACYDFQIQVRDAKDASKLNIENASTIWPDELTSYVTVARITIPASQTPNAPAEIEQCEQLAFTPWQAHAAHRPVGGINRVRSEVYERSAAHRGAAQ